MFIKLYKKLELISSLNSTVTTIIMAVILFSLILFIYYFKGIINKKSKLIDKTISKFDD